MSKERLEDFREFIDFMYESLDIEDHQRFVAISESMIKDGWFKWIYRYAKEQAERVQELEGELHFCKITKLSMDSVEKYTSQLKQQNKRYREALEFYADEDNYRVTWDDDYEPILHDDGSIARKALEESE